MVSDALYFSDWYGAQEKFKQSMLLMMARSTRHLEFTAGKFVPLVLATFVSVCLLCLMKLRRIQYFYIISRFYEVPTHFQHFLTNLK